MTQKRKKLYLIDGSSYIFRAFYAIQPLSNSKGLPTNAIYGFVRMLLKFIKDEKPESLAVIFDTEEPTFRDKLYEDYKANRSEPPDDLLPQFPYFERIVDALGIKRFAMPGFEADDLIGTVAKKAEADGYDVVITTGDKDFMQLVNNHISLFDTMKDRRVGEAEVREKFGVEPGRVIDVMSLTGDSSDNVPGVSGIGNKGAVSLIKQFGSLDNLLANIDKVSNVRSRTALKEGGDKARLSRELVTIKLDVPVDVDWSEFETGRPDASKVKELFSELEFFKLIQEIAPDEYGGMAVECRIVSGGEDLGRLSKNLKTFETTALYFIPGRPYLGLGIAWLEGTAYIPMTHETLEDVANVNSESVKDFLNDLKDKKIYIYDLKQVLKGLKGMGAGFGEGVVDVKLMSYVLNPAYPENLITLAQQVLGLHLQGVTEAKKGGGDKGREAKKKENLITAKEAANQAGSMASIVFQLADRFSEDLSKNDALNRLYNDIEMPLLKVLFKMEEKGIRVDSERLEVLAKEFEGKISDLEKKIYSEAGESFSINSPKQLAKILFEKLGLPPVKKTKTGYSTDASVLEELAENYELPKMVLEYRSLSKLKSTYIDVLPALADRDGRIHTTFNQAVTATGRLSSSDPNLQNIPVRTDEGLRIRRTFIAGKGLKLMSADYSQIELRVLAHISGEKALIQAFEEGADVHTDTAARIFGVDKKSVDSRMRGAAKTVNFGVLYGQSAFGLSKQLDIEVGEADAYIKNYYENYPAVKKLKEKILKDAAENGFVETLFGRRRYVPDINSHNQQMKAFAERTAFNTVFQGTAADIIKKAMLELDGVLQADFPDVHMLLQVHDELIFEVAPSQINELTKVVREKMCGAADIKIPLVVDIGVGDNWAECK